MTEERVEAAMERMGAAIEKRVERAADRAWRFRPVRFAAKALSLAAGAGLLLSALPLAEKGSHTASKICFISGARFLPRVLRSLC